MTATDTTAKVAEAIAAVTETLDRGLMTSDPDLAAAQFTDDAVFGESGMEDVVGRAAIRDFFVTANQVRTITYHRHHRQEILILEGRAIELSRFDETKVKPGQAPIQERGRVVSYWRLEADGAWRIARMVVSDLPPLT